MFGRGRVYSRAEMENRYARAQEEIAELKRKNHDLYVLAKTWQSRAKQSANTVEGLRAEVAQLSKFVDQLMTKVLNAHTPDPIVIPAPDLTDQLRIIMEGMVKLAYGNTPPDNNQPTPEQIAEQIVNTSPFYPDFEFDPILEDETKWPVQGGWVAGTPSPVMEGTTPTHQVVQGKVVRTDGTPTFEAGTGSPMPTGGVE